MSKKATTSSFVAEFLLKTSPHHEKVIDTRLDRGARLIYNACTGESLKRLDLMRESDIYKEATEAHKQAKEKLKIAKKAKKEAAATKKIAEKAKRKLKEIEKINNPKKSKKWSKELEEAIKSAEIFSTEKSEEFDKAEKETKKKAEIASAAERKTSKLFKQARKKFRFSQYEIQSWATQFTKTYFNTHGHIKAVIVETLAKRAYDASEKYMLGIRGKPKMKKIGQLNSVEGKSQNGPAQIYWAGDDTIEWDGLKIPVIINLSRNGEWDEVVQHALSSRIKFCRIIRRKGTRIVKGQNKIRNRYYVQLVLEGTPFQKYEAGDDIVGIDIGPSTLAIVAKSEAHLEQFCSELKSIMREIRVLQRKIDRQRRANNPDCYDEKGRPITGKRPTNKSKRQKITEAKLRRLQQRHAKHRKNMHGALVRKILEMGGVVKIEKLSYVAFQKRFGKSVRDRAPGTFVALLRKKAKEVGGEVQEFNTRTTKLSQTCLVCGRVKKKSLSQRIHRCPCGAEYQRDLLSAAGARFVENDKLNAAEAERWMLEGGCDTLRSAFNAVQSTTGGQSLPSSFGVRRSKDRLRA